MADHMMTKSRVRRRRDDAPPWANAHAGHVVASLLVAIMLWLGEVSIASVSAEAALPSSECQNAVTTADMRKCSANRYQAAQRALNEVYAGLMHKMDGGQRIKLRTAQRAWLRFRDAEADFVADTQRGGTLAWVLRTQTLADLTVARTEELRKNVSVYRR